MAIFECNETAVNTRYVTLIGEVKPSMNTKYFSFHIGIHGRDGFTAKYNSEAEASDARSTLIQVINGGSGRGR